MRRFLFFVSWLFPALLWLEPALALRLDRGIAYYPQHFYDRVEKGAQDDDLKQLLFKVLSSAHISGTGHDELTDECSKGDPNCYRHISLGYRPARQILFGSLHLIETSDGYAIQDAYCKRTVTAKDFKKDPPGPGKIPDSAVINAEHTWPQSRFTSRFSKEMQKSDLNILFPVISHANSARGNIEFGDVVTAVSSPCPLSKRGYAARGGTQDFFEVPDNHKGYVARAIFYFSVRYQSPVSDLEEEMLRQWHRQAPVDDFEKRRLEGIFAKQKVRNPFIDHPELVESITNF